MTSLRRSTSLPRPAPDAVRAIDEILSLSDWQPVERVRYPELEFCAALSRFGAAMLSMAVFGPTIFACLAARTA